MNENDVKIVRFTNIADFDFSSEMGAMYDGRPFFVKSGESKLYPFTLGDHLATHLARQIIIRQTSVNVKDDTNGSGRPLWNDQTINALKAKIISEVYEEERRPVLSEADKMVAKVAELNKVVDAPVSTPAVGYKDKAEVLAALKAKGVSPDARQSKAKLEAQLVELSK